MGLLQPTRLRSLVEYVREILSKIFINSDRIGPSKTFDQSFFTPLTGDADILPEIFPGLLPEIFPEIFPRILLEILPEIFPEIFPRKFPGISFFTPLTGVAGLFPERFPELSPELFPGIFPGIVGTLFVGTEEGGTTSTNPLRSLVE